MQCKCKQAVGKSAEFLKRRVLFDAFEANGNEKSFTYLTCTVDFTSQNVFCKSSFNIYIYIDSDILFLKFSQLGKFPLFSGITNFIKKNAAGWR